jgi:hypothetical protein
VLLWRRVRRELLGVELGSGIVPNLLADLMLQ